MKTKTSQRSTIVDAATLRRGDRVKFDRASAIYTVERWEEHRPGAAWLVCHGPLGNPSSGVVGGGQAFYVGPKSTRTIDAITGKRRTLKPKSVRLVERAGR